MMKDNVIKLDWDDEILAKTVLTHAGELKDGATKDDAKPAGDGGAKAVRSTTKAA